MCLVDPRLPGQWYVGDFPPTYPPFAPFHYYQWNGATFTFPSTNTTNITVTTNGG